MGVGLGTSSTLVPERSSIGFPSYAWPVGKLPSGTVTLVFTDIEGSTALASALGRDWVGVLGDHHRIVGAACAEHGGVVVRTEGDAFFVAFERADGAVAACDAAQRALAAHPWPSGHALRVRMGVHTGVVELVDDDYAGVEVHYAARVAAAAHGGQVLLSVATRRLAPAARAESLRRHTA